MAEREFLAEEWASKSMRSEQVREDSMPTASATVVTLEPLEKVNFQRQSPWRKNLTFLTNFSLIIGS